MNTNNIKTGNVNIPGPLHSTASDSQDQIGNVVAYTGDIYDTTLLKNQSQINQELLGSSSSSPVTESNGGYVLGSTSIAHAGSFAEGYQAYAYGGYSHAEGVNTSTVNGNASHVEGNGTKSNGGANHAEGYITKSYGTASHSEGYKTTALNDYSHAEGNNTVAIAEAAHSEGIQTIAYGKASHAEGYGGNNLDSTNVIEVSEGPGGLCQLKTSTPVQVGDILMIDWTINPNNTTLRLKVLEILEEASDYTLVKVDAPVSQISDIPADYEAYTVLSSCKAAYGTYSHVEGYKTTASGDYSHAEGVGTETTNAAEHASGKYNQSIPSVTQFSVGVGADAEHRANAFEVDVNGNIYIQDIGNYDGTSITNVDSLQTVITDVNTRLSDLESAVLTGDNIVIATSPRSEFYSTNKGAEDNVIIGSAGISYGTSLLLSPGSFKKNIIVGNSNNLNNCDYTAVSGSVIFGNNNNVTGGICIGLSNTNQSTSDARSMFTLLGTRLTAGDSTNITYNYNFIPYATVIGVNNNPTTFNGIYSSYRNGDWTDAGAFEVGAGKNNTSVSILAQKSDGNLYIKGVGGWDGMSPVKDRKSINTIISEFETRIAALESQIAALTNNL